MSFAKQSSGIFESIISLADSSDLVEDIFFDSEFLEIHLADGSKFIINKRTSCQEIWLTCQKTGPYHFRYNNNNWVSSCGTDILSLLKANLF